MAADLSPEPSKLPRPVFALVIAAWALLHVGWVIGNPPFASPDEWAHYLRVIDIQSGELVGEPASYDAPPTVRPLPAGSLNDLQRAWVNQASRQVQVPPGLSPRGFSCNAGLPDKPAACQYEVRTSDEARVEVIPNGTYQPWMYIPPSLLTGSARTAISLDYLGRATVAATSLFLLIIAAIALRDQKRLDGVSVSSLMLGVTPMVVFVGSSLSPSGPEIAAGLALTATLARLGRSEIPSRSSLILVTLSGVTLSLSKSLGPGLMALIGVYWIVWLGPSRLFRMLRTYPQRSLSAGAVLALALFLNRLWEYLYGPRVKLGFSSLGVFLEDMRHVPGVLREYVGVFGYLEVGPPRLVYIIWLALVWALVILALAVGSRSERLGLALAVTFALLIPIVLLSGMLRHTGFGVQGRHTLALAVGVPVLAGETIRRNFDRLKELRINRMPLLVASFAALCHGIAWYTNARRSAVGLNGPILFAGRSEWVPPVGWWPWAISVGMAAVLLTIAGALGSYSGLKPQLSADSQPKPGSTE